MFPDGHWGWYIPRGASPFKGYYTLGFVATYTQNNYLIVKKVYEKYNSVLFENDTILSIQKKPARVYIQQFAKKDPQSTKESSYEVAARNISLIKPRTPLYKSLENIKIKVKRKGKVYVYDLEWKRCPLSSNIKECMEDSSVLLIQGNGHLSLEEYDTVDYSYHKSFYLSYKTIMNKKIAILHIKDFNKWKQTIVDSIIRNINKENPNSLIIDLKDSAGGGFDCVLYLSYSLGIQKEYTFQYDYINNENKRIKTTSNFNFITNSINKTNAVYNGKLFVRTNEICGSACDFFARHIQANKRGKIIGQPPAGRGGGTDSFKLTHTFTLINIPQRERIPHDYKKSIESEIMSIYLKSEQPLDLLIEELIKRGDI